MMTFHWNYFIAIEEDLENLSRYIELRDDNLGAYSIETAKILMAATQEVDVLLKAICRHHNVAAANINDYCKLMTAEYPAIFDAEVRLDHHALVRVPFKGWGVNQPPAWWTANNKVKHERDTSFGSASLGNVIDAVGALLLTNICNYVVTNPNGSTSLIPRRPPRMLSPGRGWAAISDPVLRLAYSIPGERAPKASPIAAPRDGLGIYVTSRPTSGEGQIALALRIENKSDGEFDTSNVTLRYWYEGEALGTDLVLNSHYVSIGASNQGKATGVKALETAPPRPGADHYLEITLAGILAPKGDRASNDRFTLNLGIHNREYRGNVVVTNDYSYNGGAVGYNDKMTLHDRNGDVLWGTVPT